MGGEREDERARRVEKAAKTKGEEGFVSSRRKEEMQGKGSDWERDGSNAEKREKGG